ncbi:MAG: hypothetical protein LAO04_18115 [Acidobacteriia bacterium]|nr:hypothetical protein [Terriglobia bacterium]
MSPFRATRRVATTSTNIAKIHEGQLYALYLLAVVATREREKNLVLRPFDPNETLLQLKPIEDHH